MLLDYTEGKNTTKIVKKMIKSESNLNKIF